MICINCGAKAEKGCATFIAGEPAPQAALSPFTQNAKFGDAKRTILSKKISDFLSFREICVFQKDTYNRLIFQQ